MGDAFSHYHPLVNFLFFALVLAYSMVLMHPVCLAVSLTGALVYAGELGGRRALAGHLKFALPVLLLAAIVNPAFNHAGVTILTYLPSGNPLTLESILYGLAAGAMLCAVVLWFVCFNAVITSDKFVYLFGPVPGAEHDIAVRAPVPAAAGGGAPGPVLHRPGRLLRQRVAAGPPGCDHLFHHGHLGPGKRHRNRRQHEKPGLRPAGPDGLLHLSHGEPGPVRPGVAGLLRAVSAVRMPGRGTEVVVLPLAAGGHDPAVFHQLFGGQPPACVVI